MADRKRGPVKPPTIDMSARADAPDGKPPARTRRRAEAPPAAPSGGDEPAAAPTAPAGDVPAAAADTGPTPEPAPRQEPATDMPADAVPAGEPSGEETPTDDSFRPADLPEAEAEAKTRAQEAPQFPDAPASPAPTPPAPPVAATPVLPLLLAAVGGGGFVLAVAYGLAMAGLWPAREPPADPRIEATAEALPQLAALEGATTTLAADLEAAEARLTALEAEVAGRLDAAEAAGADLREAVETLAATRLTAADVAPLAEELGALSDRIDAVAAGASADDAAGLATALATLRAEIEAIGAAQAAAGTRLDAADQALAALGEDAAGIEAALAGLGDRFAAFEAEAATAPGPEAVEVPLLLSSLQSALAAGQPFAAEMARISVLIPGLEIGAALTAAAPGGLPRPDQLAARFSADVPAILAAAPADPDAPWADAALERLRALFAIRPSGEVGGDAPDAVVARLEAALERQDFAVADALFDALPAPMRDAAGELPDLVSAHAEAAAFAAAAREQALAPDAAGAAAAP